MLKASSCGMLFVLIFLSFPSPSVAVDVLGIWGGDEIESFRAMVSPWEEKTGVTVDFSGTRDLSAVLTTRVAAGNPPDIAILPNTGMMVELVESGKLVPLDSFLDMGLHRQEYSRAWIDLGTVRGKLYGLFMKADSKSTVWYSPAMFAARGWKVPATWDELIALSSRIMGEGMHPWSMAVESGEASGWPVTDWIGEILLHESGPEVYDQWVRHDIPWTDGRIRSAWEKFGRIALTPGYVPGSVAGILATGFIDGSYLPFTNPPRAAMYFLGAFTQGFIAAQFPNLEPGRDYAFYRFPAIDQQWAGAVTGGANVVVAFRDNTEVRSLIGYLASAQAQEIWVKRGGFTAVNGKVGLELYPDPLARMSAEQLAFADVFRFDADDSMPPAVQKAFWEGILDYLQDPESLARILEEIEARAAEAYR
jgi:alpha-glucoside transport system substrate-binding protein